MYNQILSFLYSLPPIPLIYENDWKLGKNLQIKLAFYVTDNSNSSLVSSP